MDPRSPGRETFGTCLLRSPPKIIARHEEELKLLESLHQHMSKRVKADTDYAEQLSKINAAALKACPKDAKGAETNSIMQVKCECTRAGTRRPVPLFSGMRFFGPDYLV